MREYTLCIVELCGERKYCCHLPIFHLQYFLNLVSFLYSSMAWFLRQRKPVLLFIHDLTNSVLLMITHITIHSSVGLLTLHKCNDSCKYIRYLTVCILCINDMMLLSGLSASYGEFSVLSPQESCQRH